MKWSAAPVADVPVGVITVMSTIPAAPAGAVATIAVSEMNVYELAAVVPKFIAAMGSGRPPLVHGDGTQSRDFSYVSNVVEANLLAAGAEKVGGEVFNVACGQRASLLDLVACLNRILGTSIEPNFGPPRPGDVKHSMADIGHARSLLGYEPRVLFEEGLARTVAWYRRAGSRPS